MYSKPGQKTYEQHQKTHKQRQELKKRELERACLSYTKNVVCHQKLTSKLFQTDGVIVEFDSHYRFADYTCTDVKVYDCIMDTDILPNVCAELVFRYLPNKIQVRVYTCESIYCSRVILKRVQICINDQLFTFQCGKHYAEQIYASNSYYYGKIPKNFLEMFEYIVGRVACTTNYDALLKTINRKLALNYKCTIVDGRTFLKIMSCMLLLKQYIPKAKKIEKSCVIT